jgi:hypothetical protein
MMKYLLLGLLLWMADPPLFPWNDIAKTNALIKQAKQALDEERFDEAASNYRILLDSFGVEDSQIQLNLAHALLKSDQKEEAGAIYRNLSGSLNAEHRSVANQQLGNLAIENNELDAAIGFYKSALKANPENEEARYNYELAKKLKQEQEQQEEDQEQQEENQEEQEEGEEEQEQEQGKEGENQEEQKEQEKGEENEETGEEQKQEGEAEQETSEENEQPQDQEEKSEEQKQMEMMQNLKEKLEEMEMNEETAMMILEALRNQEIQYLQQMRRKATQNRKSGKPDW